MYHAQRLCWGPGEPACMWADLHLTHLYMIMQSEARAGAWSGKPLAVEQHKTPLPQREALKAIYSAAYTLSQVCHVLHPLACTCKSEQWRLASKLTGKGCASYAACQHRLDCTARCSIRHTSTTHNGMMLGDTQLSSQMRPSLLRCDQAW